MQTSHVAIREEELLRVKERVDVSSSAEEIKAEGGR